MNAVTQFKTIGVIGGMGPAATVHFQSRLVELTAASDDQDHVPLLIDMNPQIPSRIAALLEGGAVNPGPVLGQMARGLEENGAAAILMPCNTAHYYAEFIENNISIPFLNMIRLSAQKLSKAFGEGARIGMLASPATDQFSIFQSVFDRFNLHAIFPDDPEQVLDIIRRIKAQGMSGHMTEKVQLIVDELRHKDIVGYLIGCSEFSMFQAAIKARHPVYDSVDIIARSAIEFSGAKPN